MLPPASATPQPPEPAPLSLSPGDSPSPVIHVIHHFACTGGSLISKCIAAQPDVVLLSEIDPLSLIGVSPARPIFSPRSVIEQLRYNQRGNSDALITAVFQSEIKTLLDGLAREGQSLVLRDHAHSHYCVGSAVPDRPNLRAILTAVATTRSIVTVRHPIESYLSLLSKGNWLNIIPQTLDEYCLRYARFLDDYADQPVFRYEDFLTAPEDRLREICAALGLPHEPGAMDLRDSFPVSGDSGRGGKAISPRPRRPIPTQVIDQAESAAYPRLCRRLGYDSALS
ncbi:MAG: sulfotransferase [bacterium]